jgi:uncharacterized GH25 family protein
MDFRLQWFSSYSVTVVTETSSSLFPTTWPVRLQIEHWLQRRVLQQNQPVPNGKVGSECYIIFEMNIICHEFKVDNF